VHNSPSTRFSPVSGANGALCETKSPLTRRDADSGAKCTLAAARVPALPTQPPLTLVFAYRRLIAAANDTASTTPA
jgi:hypothetical protein